MPEPILTATTLTKLRCTYCDQLKDRLCATCVGCLKDEGDRGCCECGLKIFE